MFWWQSRVRLSGSDNWFHFLVVLSFKQVGYISVFISNFALLVYVKWIQEVYICSVASVSWPSLLLRNAYHKTRATGCIPLDQKLSVFISHLAIHMQCKMWNCHRIWGMHATLTGLVRPVHFCIQLTFYMTGEIVPFTVNNEKVVENGKWT